MSEGGRSTADRASTNNAAQQARTTPSQPAVPVSEADEQPLSSAAKSPDEIWGDYFSKRRPNPKTVRDLVARLHDAKRYDHVIAVIRSAIRTGQVQPWMYEVLALTLEIQGAPREEVERALLSQIDFAATDSASLMISAAYLTRFKADKPALRLYRQASELSPERPEPYLLGLKIARRLHDDDALAWAVRGVFASAWGDDHQRQQTDAANAVADRVRELRDAKQSAEADSLEAMLASARQVDLHVRLEWGGDGDLDLSVHEPPRTVCSFENPRTAAGGVLIHDGHGPKQDNCFDEYVCAAAFPGVYRIEIRHAWGDIVGKRAKVTVTLHRGTEYESVRVTTVPVTEEGTVLRVTVSSGRRDDLLALPDEPKPASNRAPRLVKRLDADAQAAADRFRDSLFRQVGGVATGLNPAVGIGAVGYQPVVTVIPDGITLNAQAVVSPDRRYVRLTLNPSFTDVIDVLTFTFSSGL
jgi:hypothetical protein